jgi:hypothetical protein
LIPTKDHVIRKKILIEIAKHPGIKISEIAKYSGISFQVVNKILKEPWMIWNFVKSTVNKKEKSNIKSFLTFETKNGEDEDSIISRYEEYLDVIKEYEEEQKLLQEEIMADYKNNS